MKLTMGLVKADMIAANQAISYFEENNIRDIKNIAAYHLQQATEKLIKIQVYERCSSFSDYKLYTHNIEKLIAYADSLEVGVFVPKYIRDNSLVITDWEAGSRYDVGFSVRISTLKRISSEVFKWYEKVRCMK